MKTKPTIEQLKKCIKLLELKSDFNIICNSLDLAKSFFILDNEDLKK